MAYLLDLSPSTFDRLVVEGKLPTAVERDGIKRWHVDEVIAAWNDPLVERADDDRVDPFMAGLGGFRGKKEGRRGAS